MLGIDKECFEDYFYDNPGLLENSEKTIKDLKRILEENPVYHYKKELGTLKISPEDENSLYSFLCLRKFHIEIAKHQIKFQTLRSILNGINFSKIKIENLFASFIQPCSFNILCKIFKVLSRCQELNFIKDEMEGFIIVQILAYLNTEILDHSEKFTTLRLLSSCKNDNLILEEACKILELKFEMTTTENRILSKTKLANYVPNDFYQNPIEFQEKKSQLPIQSREQFELGEQIHARHPNKSRRRTLGIHKIIQNIIPEKKLVAKVTKSDCLSKLNQEEADLLVEMKSTENIVEVFGVILEENPYTLYIILEEAPLTLAKNIEKWHSRDLYYRQNHQDERESEALSLLKQMLEAIMALRSKNIWHRDIKPDNILVFNEGYRTVYKLTDFDVSRKHKRCDYGDTVESHLIQVGTGSYIAPELISGKIYMDKFNVKNINYNKSDVYSLGITVYEFLFTLSEGKINCYMDELQSIINRRLEDNVRNKTLKEYLREMLCVNCKARISFANLYKLIQDEDETFIEQ
ncbi:hypothetical protein SteCoe_1029 [Stentor coeruleus]|uniref:Protein kinase domain-containing protein n=1 Tax=Stentor coeruleus TaxID=5963 RepID=A0A1R2D2X3_9CILI|nr:hypothetical protein SteCoe_1029 [Stentor coeruleus]